MKSQVAQTRAGSGETPAPAAATEAATGEFPAVGGEPEGAEDDEDVFKEIPTVANRTNPTSEASAASTGAALPEGPHEGAGTYRIVRPTTSDVIDTPTATGSDPNAARRVIIGAARKPR